MLKINFQKDKNHKDKYVMILSNDKGKETLSLKDLSTKSKVEFKIFLEGENYMEALNNLFNEAKKNKKSFKGIIPKEYLLQYSEFSDNIKSDLTYSLGKNSKTYEFEKDNIGVLSFGDKKFLFLVYKKHSVILDLQTGDTLITDYIFTNVIKENKNYIYILKENDGYDKGGFLIDISKGFSYLIEDKNRLNFFPTIKDNSKKILNITNLIGKTLNSEIFNSGLRYYIEDKYIARDYSIINIFYGKEKLLISDNYKIIDEIFSYGEAQIVTPFKSLLDDIKLEEIITNKPEEIVEKIYIFNGKEKKYQLSLNKSNLAVDFKKIDLKENIQIPTYGTEFLYELKEQKNGKYKLGDIVVFIEDYDNHLVYSINLNTNEISKVKEVRNPKKYIYHTGKPYLLLQEDNLEKVFIFNYSGTGYSLKNSLINKKIDITNKKIKGSFIRFLNTNIVNPNFSIIELRYEISYIDHIGSETLNILIEENGHIILLEKYSYSSLTDVLKIIDLKDGRIKYFVSGKEQKLDYIIEKGNNTIAGYKYGQTNSGKKGILVDKYLIEGEEFEIYYGKNYFKQKLIRKEKKENKIPTLKEIGDLDKEKYMKIISFLEDKIGKTHTKTDDLYYRNFEEYHSKRDYFTELINILILQNYKIIFDELRRKKEKTGYSFEGIGIIDFDILSKEKISEIKNSIKNIIYYETLLGQKEEWGKLDIEKILRIDKDYIEIKINSDDEDDDYNYIDTFKEQIEIFNNGRNRIKANKSNNYKDVFYPFVNKYHIEFLSEKDLEICPKCGNNPCTCDVCSNCGSKNVTFVRRGNETGYTHKVLLCKDCGYEVTV